MAKKTMPNRARSGAIHSSLQKVPKNGKVGLSHAPTDARRMDALTKPSGHPTMTTQYNDNRRFEPEFPFTGERGDALIALLGPKALNELKVLLRLAAPRSDVHATAPSDKLALKEAA